MQKNAYISDSRLL